MNYKNAIEGLIKLKKHYKNPTIILTGGEPTVYPEFEKILDFILDELNLPMGICSNGTTDFFKDKILKYKDQKNFHIQFSIDGNREQNDKIRGQGSFNKTINNLENLISHNFNAVVSTTVTPANINSMDELCNLFESINLKRWKVSPFLPYGRAQDYENLIPTKDWNEFVKHMISIANLSLGIRTLYDFKKLDLLSDLDLRKLEEQVAKNKSCNCGSGNQKIYVYPNMTVYGCTCALLYPFGNLENENFEDIMSSNNAMQIKNYQLIDASPCNKCRYVKICNGGCIGMSNSYFDKLGMGDVRCPNFNSLNK